MTPTIMRALVLAQGRKAQVVENHPVPKIADGEVLVKVHAATQNPSDWLNIINNEPGGVLGYDFAGTVEEVCGEPSNDLKKGDRVAGFVHGGKFADEGSYAEYLKAEHDLLIKLPEHLSFEQGASYGLAFMTAVHALYACLRLPTPENPASKSFPFLVWGGASSLGLFAIQLAKLSGAFVIATASPQNNALVKSYGADQVFDYHDESTPQMIRAAYPHLEFCLDCISKGLTISQATRAIGEAGGHVHLVLPPPEGFAAPRKDVRLKFALVVSVLGRSFPRYSYEPTPSPSTLSHDRRLAHDWMNFDKGLAYPLILSGEVKPNPIKRWLGGLDEINAAIEYMQSGKVSGEKIAHLLA